MFNSKTLFIVGAGASKEAGLPIGNELADIISKLLHFEFDFGRVTKGDVHFINNFISHFRDNQELDAYLVAGRQISDGIHLANSIDNYIDTHRENAAIQLCGKAAIVYSILNTEMGSILSADPDNFDHLAFYRKLRDTWYLDFASILFDGRALSDIDSMFDDISIICFNYDRCIEQFLTYALQPLYVIDQNRAEELVAKLKIYHPYGTVGILPTGQRSNGVRFGCNPWGVDAVELASEIKTYTEQVEDKEVLQGIKGEVASAETLVFLGFAFHPQNMELLTPDERTGDKRIFATALNISDQDSVVVRRQALQLSVNDHLAAELSDRNYPDIQIRNDIGCCDLFRNYRRRLSLI